MGEITADEKLVVGLKCEGVDVAVETGKRTVSVIQRTRRFIYAGRINDVQDRIAQDAGGRARHGVAQHQTERQRAAGLAVINNRHREKFRDFAVIERQLADRVRIVHTRQGRPVHGEIADRDDARTAANADDRDKCAASGFFHGISGGVELHLAREIHIDDGQGGIRDGRKPQHLGIGRVVGEAVGQPQRNGQVSGKNIVVEYWNRDGLDRYVAIVPVK